MHVRLNLAQRAALFSVALVIVFLQAVQFDDRRGPTGYGWVFSFLSAGVLIVIGLAKNSPAEPLTKSPTPGRPLPDKEEIAAAHSAYRENAEILAVEVEQRANALADSLIKDNLLIKHLTNGELAFSIHGSKERGDGIVEAMKIQLRERCTYLMLGLVGMRRSKGSKVYITGIEFKTLQQKVSERAAQLAVVSHRLVLPSQEMNAEAFAKSMQDNIQQVRKAITQYCLALESSQAEPEAPLLDWFESAPGLKIRNNPQVAQTLTKLHESDYFHFDPLTQTAH